MVYTKYIELLLIMYIYTVHVRVISLNFISFMYRNAKKKSNIQDLVFVVNSCWWHAFTKTSLNKSVIIVLSFVLTSLNYASVFRIWKWIKVPRVLKAILYVSSYQNSINNSVAEFQKFLFYNAGYVIPYTHPVVSV